MKKIAWILLCVLSASAPGLFLAGSVQALGPCGPGYCPPAQKPPPQSVQRTVNVQVPVQRPLPPMCLPPNRCGVPPCPPPIKPVSVPVRVNVAVTPSCEPPRKMVPVVYRSPGILKPVIRHAAGLVGASLAAPFRAADMFLPTYCPSMSQRRPPCGPRGMGRGPVGFCGVPGPRCAPPQRCCSLPCPPPCPPRCAPPMQCAPPGGSLSPLPRPACPSPCMPYIPPRMVQDAEYPCLEPRSLLAGIVNLPFRLLQRGRPCGDMNRIPPGPPCGPPCMR